MSIAAADRLYAYIENKTEKLKEARKGAVIRTRVVWAVGLGLWLSGQIDGGDALLLMLVASAWASLHDAVCNQHIDALATLHRDLDRDSAESLYEFETPR